MESESISPFARVRLPGSSEVLNFEPKDGKLTSPEGWVFSVSPFDHSQEALMERIAVNQDEHVSIVQQAIQHIQSGRLQKVVISRIKEVPLVHFSDSSEGRIFQALCEKYPQACVFAYRMNVHSVWIGATPEVLVSKKGKTYTTMALAGTRTAAGSSQEWGDKEKHEQAVVTDFILERIRQNGGNSVECNGPYTAQAAHLEHIRTDIQFYSEKNITDWIHVFHPTPAVCGMPVEEAKNFILNQEKHLRKMYAGFFLIENANGDGQAFVQLRCMELANDRAFIYVGGGIMGDSNAYDEWMETENKAMVMQRVLEDLNLS